MPIYGNWPATIFIMFACAVGFGVFVYVDRPRR